MRKLNYSILGVEDVNARRTRIDIGSKEIQQVETGTRGLSERNKKRYSMLERFNSTNKRKCVGSFLCEGTRTSIGVKHEFR